MGAHICENEFLGEACSRGGLFEGGGLFEDLRCTDQLNDRDGIAIMNSEVGH